MIKRTRNEISERVIKAKDAIENIKHFPLPSITTIKQTIINYIEKNECWKNAIDTNKIFIKEKLADAQFSEYEKDEFLNDNQPYVWIAFSENNGIIQVGKTKVGIDDLFKKITLGVPLEILIKAYGSPLFNDELTTILATINDLYSQAIIIPIKNEKLKGTQKNSAQAFEQEIGDYLLDQENPIILTHSHSSWLIRESDSSSSTEEC